MRLILNHGPRCAGRDLEQEYAELDHGFQNQVKLYRDLIEKAETDSSMPLGDRRNYLEICKIALQKEQAVYLEARSCIAQEESQQTAEEYGVPPEQAEAALAAESDNNIFCGNAVQIPMEWPEQTGQDRECDEIAY